MRENYLPVKAPAKNPAHFLFSAEKCGMYRLKRAAGESKSLMNSKILESEKPIGHPPESHRAINSEESFWGD
jgi:hypothetical protein